MSDDQYSLGLVKFECGCVGWVPAIRPDEGKTHMDATCIKHCDRTADGSPYGLIVKQVPARWESMPLPAQKAVVQEMGRLIAEGGEFRKLKAILGISDA